MKRGLLVCLLLVLAPVGAANAYIGPGVGAGAIGAVLGVLGGIGLAIFSIIYYPIKRALKMKKKKAKPAESPDVAAKP